MVKSELAEKLAEKNPDLPEHVIKTAINKIFESIRDALGRGERVEIRGIGSFSRNYLPPRNAHNPKTGERVAAQGKFTCHFKQGKALRYRVNKHHANS